MSDKLDRAYNRETKLIEKQLENGDITLDEYNKIMREMMIDYREADKTDNYENE